MKKILHYVASILVSLLVVLTLANAAQLKEARVTQIVSDVKLLPQQAAPRPAALHDPVREGTAVRTGTQSRSELTFNDLTITRLGANTIFSFEEGTRMMDLRDGAVLFQVPKGSGGATIRTTAVTAAITGTTGIGEFHPATSNRPHPFSKWLCLEGTFHLILPNGQKVELGPGKMVTTDGKNFSPVQSFNISQVMKTSLLVNSFDSPLASLPLIQIEQENQVGLRTPITNLSSLFNSTDIIDVVDQGMTAQESPTVTPTPSTPTPTPTPSTPTPTPSTPTPTPSKFGTLTVIASSDPYVITSGTHITTDPSITTNGQTDYGKIYRSQAQDGLLSAFLFGSTSAFDTASGFDAALTGLAMGGAGFKFTSLELTGNPTISTIGGAVNLGLIAVNDITSGGPGGVLTFAGIRGLLLATQNGSITLGPGISFSGLQDITFYARGAGSVLTLASDVTTTNKIRLYGQDGIHLSSNLSTEDLIAYTGGDFDLTAGSLDAGRMSIFAGGDVNFTVGGPLSFHTSSFDLEATGNFQADDSLEVTEDDAGQTDGLNISLVSGGTTNVTSDLSLTIVPTAIDTGANITVQSGGNTTIGGALTLLVNNSNGGHIGAGGNISFTTGGSLTADSIDALVNNREAGSVDSGGNVTFDIGGALTTTADASFVTSNRNDGNGGGTIGSNVAVTLNAASVSAGGFFITDISTNGGGMIPNATVRLNLTGALVATGGAEIDIQNTGFNMFGGPFIAAPAIGTDAKVNVNAGSISSGDFLDVEIDNNGAGHIGRDAIISVTASNSISSLTDMYFDLTNQANGGAAPGFIGRNASINLSAANISAGGLLDLEVINDAGGHIGGNALLNVHASGSVMAQSDSYFEVLNRLQNSDGVGSVGGDIVGNATNSFSAGGNLTADGVIEFGVLNNDSRFLNGAGSIGGDATIAFSAANVSSTNFFNLAINNAEGSIGGDAKIDAHASSISTDDRFFAHILNETGAIGGDVFVAVATTGAINASSDVIFEIANPGGAIGGNATISVNAPSIVTGGMLFASIDNTSGGSIGGSSAINMNLSGNANIDGDATIQIYGSNSAASAVISINGGNYDVGGTFFNVIDGDGTIAFNNASVHADVLRAGVFGTNGVLNIGGGTLSADTTLKLYASGSNGQLNFISNVTLGGTGTKTLAANSITISNGVVVTVGAIGDGNPANVYTNNANYSVAYGGNGSTTGTFAGSGANSPQPLPSAPPFNNSARQGARHSPRVNSVRSRTPSTGQVSSPHQAGGGGRNPSHPSIRIRNSDQLLSLVENGIAGPGGKITIPSTNNANNSTNPGRPAGPDHSHAERAINNPRTSLYPAVRSP